jgi:hypothetical protein
MAFFRNAHGARLQREHGIPVQRRMTFTTFDPLDGLLAFDPALPGGGFMGEVNGLTVNNQGLAHHLLASYPLVKVERIYELVFEQILGEEVSTLPVANRG